MRLLTPQQTKRVEQAFLAQGPWSESRMIDSAGHGAATIARETFGPLKGKRVMVLCGKGHNAADGLVMARDLLETGSLVTAALAFPKEALAPETSQALDQAMAAGLGLEALPLKTGPNAAFDLLVDALVGTGAVLPLRGSLAEFALWMDGQACPVVALDLPSGVDGDSGAADGPCVNAALTVTFLAAKPGLFLEPGRSHAGAVRVHHFAGPGLDGLIKAESKLRAFDQAEAAAALPPRPYDAHKKQAAVLVVAGSKAYLGAALLCARAAYRGGAGIVRLALPEALAQTAVAALPEAVILALPGADCLGQAGLETLLTAAKDCGAMVVGPGLGRAASTQALVRALWRTAPLPALFDADALHALALGDAPAGPRVLTPHEGELKALLGPAALESGRPAAARALASAASAVALLKGPATLVAGPDGALSINTSGSAALASAGTGDVLSGLIGALLAQGAAAFDAASLGAWIHGRAGDRWAAQNAGRGLLASDLADGLPAALQEIGA